MRSITSYEFEGSAVCVKPPVSTESALVKDAITVNPGDVLVRDAATGKVTKGAADSKEFVGVAMEKRVGSSTEKRPVTYVTEGLVRVVADGAIARGHLVKTGADGKVKDLNVGGGDTFNEAIGRYEHKSAGTDGDAADGETIQVYVNARMNGLVS